MYELLYGSETLHNPMDGVFALDCTAKLSLAAPGELSFKLPAGHPMHGKIELLQKRVEIVLREGGDELFRGRAMTETRGFWNDDTYTCEGNLAYLNDIQLRPYSTEDPGMPHDPAGYFQFLVNSYNQHAAAKDSFAVGINEANRIKPTIDRENSNLVTVRQELKDKMLDKLGGYVRMRYERGRWYIDYLADGGKESAQRIEFGENLVDYMRESSAYERYTAVVPVGKDADGNLVDISSLPDGIVFEGIRKEGDRLIDMAAAERYGIIEYDLSSDAALPVNVQANGINFLRTNAMGDTLEIKAVDMHLADAGIERIDVGDYVRVVSQPHGIDGYFLCIERTINVSDPSQDTFVLGTEQATLTSVQQARIAALNAGIDKTLEEAKGASQAAKDAAKDAEEKARIFTAQPVPPYSVGDLWSQGAGGDILTCEHDRSDGEKFHASDWSLSSKYTDDALAELAKEAAEAAKDAADQAFDDAKNAADKALEAKYAADEATAKTEVIESQVTEVRQSAKTAQDAADAAQETADDAKDKADAAESAAGIAQGAAEAAKGSALDAATSAGEAVSVANEAKRQIGDVAADAVKLREDLEGRISSVSTTMEADYTKKTDLTATESKLITQIEQSAAAIKLEAGQSYAKKTDLTDVEAALNAKIEVNASGIEQAVKESTTAKADASEAKTKAQAAETAAGAASSEAAQAAAAASGAQGAADAAKADAVAAQQKANDAKTAADKAKEDFDGLSVRADVTDEQLAAAQEAVDAANKAAGTAQSAADAAKGAANAAQSTADKAKADSATAKAAADAAKAKADEAADAVAGLEGRVTTAETKITQNADSIKSVATRTTAVENKFGGYSTTEQMNSAIQQKADSITSTVSKTYATKTVVDDVKKTADAAATKVAVDDVKKTADAAKLLSEVETLQSNMKVFKNVCSVTSDTSNLKGALVITTPITPSRMIDVHIYGYNYVTGKSNIDMQLGFYNYGTSMESQSYMNKGDFSITPVRIGKVSASDTRAMIVLGDANTVWQYPKIVVDKVLVGYGTVAPDSYKDGFSAKISATIPTLTHVKTLTGVDIKDRIVSAESSITQLSDRITSNVTETTALGKRMSTVEQTASGLSVSLGNTDKAVAAAQSTANTAKTNAATAQSTANTARNEAAAAGKTATNFLEFSSSGLDVGNKSSGAWSGFRTRMAASAFQVLNAAGTVLASYGASLVELGKDSLDSVISLCKGALTINAAAYGSTRRTSILSAYSLRVGISRLDGSLGRDAVLESSVDSVGTCTTSIRSSKQTGASAYKTATVSVQGGSSASTVSLVADAIQANGNPLYGAKILYNNASGVWGTITLNETAANFKYMEFYYKKPEGDHFWNCSKVHDPNDKRVGFLVAQVAPGSVAQTLMGGVAIVGTSVSIYTMSRYNNGSSWEMDSTTLRIYRIVGYR